MESMKHDDIVVEVDVKEINELWKQDPFWIDVGAIEGGGVREKYEKVGRWIRENNRVEMCEVGYRDGVFGVHQGRYRFAWLRDHGVARIKVCVDKESINRLKQLRIVK